MIPVEAEVVEVAGIEDDDLKPLAELEGVEPTDAEDGEGGFEQGVEEPPE